jgi:hypothetical protein
MERRKLLKLIATAAISSAMPRPLLALGQDLHQQIAASGTLRTLNPHQNATVTTIAELIIPATDTPGATAARVNEFIDLILSEWCEDEEKTSFLDGLANVDVRSRDLFGKDFVQCEQKQQIEMLMELDEQLATERETIAHPRRKRRQKAYTKQFFYMMKRLTLLGYYTSEIGAEQELQYEIIPTEHAGCAPIGEGAKSSGR